MVPVFIKATGSPYHTYPSFIFVLVAIICQFSKPDVQSSKAVKWRPTPTVVMAAVIAAWAPFLTTQRPSEETIATIRSAVDQPSVASVSSDIADGHPLTRMIGGTWPSRYNADWIGAFALYLQMKAEYEGDAQQAAHYRKMTDDYVTAKIDELVDMRPDLLVIQGREKLWTPHMLADPRFLAFFADYRLLVSEDDAPGAIFVRSDAVKSVSSPGASSG